MTCTFLPAHDTNALSILPSLSPLHEKHQTILYKRIALTVIVERQKNKPNRLVPQTHCSQGCTQPLRSRQGIQDNSFFGTVTNFSGCLVTLTHTLTHLFTEANGFHIKCTSTLRCWSGLLYSWVTHTHLRVELSYTHTPQNHMDTWLRALYSTLLSSTWFICTVEWHVYSLNQLPHSQVGAMKTVNILPRNENVQIYEK